MPPSGIHVTRSTFAVSVRVCARGEHFLCHILFRTATRAPPPPLAPLTKISRRSSEIGSPYGYIAYPSEANCAR